MHIETVYTKNHIQLKIIILDMHSVSVIIQANFSEFDLWEWHEWRQSSEANELCVGWVSDTRLAEWWRNQGEFPGDSRTWSRLTGDSQPNHARAEMHVAPVIVVRFWRKLELSTNFSKTSFYQISWKSVQWFSGCYMRTNRRTDIHGEANTRVYLHIWLRSRPEIRLWKQERGKFHFVRRLCDWRQFCFISLYVRKCSEIWLDDCITLFPSLFQ
jgi:hypothetical protein